MGRQASDNLKAMISDSVGKGEILIPIVLKSVNIFPSSNLGFIPLVMPWEPRNIIKKSEKEIDADAEKHWKRLQNIAFPKCDPTPL